jgi:hypothetical protein
MRRLGLVASVFALVLLPFARGRAQSTGELHGVISFAPNATRTVSFSRQGVAVASFEVPKGNLLRVSYDDSQANNTIPAHLLDGVSGGKPRDGGPVLILDRGARLELHGNVTVRAQTREQFNQLGSGASVEQSMTQAPLTVSGQGVDVMITSAP